MKMAEKKIEKWDCFLYFCAFFDIIVSDGIKIVVIPFYYTTKTRGGKEMFAFLSSFFEKEFIDCYAPIPLSACRIVRPYLLEKEEIENGTVIVMAIPYFSPACMDPERNISAYAVSRDYHLFYRQLFERLLSALREAFPQNKFAAFADHSPIDELDAAAKAGLGKIGKNHLLITPKYSSYVFLGELITDAVLPCEPKPVTPCEGCGKCLSACPMEDCGTCLSALTQKKGELTEHEQACILKYGSLWGCDICQQVCPHTQKALKSQSIASPIPFFGECATPHLTSKILEEMSEEEFLKRAYSWRGRNTILRNLKLAEAAQEKGIKEC